MRRSTTALIVAVTLCLAGAARAHSFRCEQTFEGKQHLVLEAFPATVTASITLFNTHPADTSIGLAFVGAVLQSIGISFTPPLSLAVGASVTLDKDFTIAT